MSNCCSHRTLFHFSLQSSRLNICYYHQDLHFKSNTELLKRKNHYQKMLLLIFKTISWEFQKCMKMSILCNWPKILCHENLHTYLKVYEISYLIHVGKKVVWYRQHNEIELLMPLKGCSANKQLSHSLLVIQYFQSDNIRTSSWSSLMKPIALVVLCTL